MKYRKLHHQARQIDRLIDQHIHVKGGWFIPPEELISLILDHFPHLYIESCGWHKIVFRNSLIDQKVVLKVGTKKSIENDHRAYKRVPHSIRHQFFARIFWHTKYCLLQEYGFFVNVTTEELDCFRRVVYTYGIFDVKADNIRKINGELKIIDANSTRIPIPTILRKVDQIKPKLPKKLDLLIKRITKRVFAT